MKKYFLFWMTLFLFPSIYAQEKQDRELNFYYIAHDRSTNVQHLSRELQQQFDNLKEYDNVGIFYLANGEEPIIIQVNTPNENEKEFPYIIGELQEKLGHDITAYYDVDRIISLFEEIPFLDEKRHLLYSSVNWNYYITSNFWSMLYNESIIGTLYWVMNMDELRRDEDFYINILRSSDDLIDFDKNNAIGIKNYSNINSNVAIVTY